MNKTTHFLVLSLSIFDFLSYYTILLEKTNNVEFINTYIFYCSSYTCYVPYTVVLGCRIFVETARMSLLFCIPLLYYRRSEELFLSFCSRYILFIEGQSDRYDTDDVECIHWQCTFTHHSTIYSPHLTELEWVELTRADGDAGCVLFML